MQGRRLQALRQVHQPQLVPGLRRPPPGRLAPEPGPRLVRPEIHSVELVVVAAAAISVLELRGRRSRRRLGAPPPRPGGRGGVGGGAEGGGRAGRGGGGRGGRGGAGGSPPAPARAALPGHAAAPPLAGFFGRRAAAGGETERKCRGGRVGVDGERPPTGASPDPPATHTALGASSLSPTSPSASEPRAGEGKPSRPPAGRAAGPPAVRWGWTRRRCTGWRRSWWRTCTRRTWGTRGRGCGRP